MKRLLFLMVAFAFIISNVRAEECTITNHENVEIPCDLYSELGNYYSENFLNFMTSEEYNIISNSNLEDIEVVTLEDNPLNNRGSYYQTSFKELRITRNGNFIVANLNRIIDPAARSYDVFGIRFLGPQIVGTPLFREYYTINGVTYSSSSYSRKDFSNGFGISVKLPVYQDLESDITFTYTGSGTIYASYQHATSNVTLAQSKKYTLSAAGYGNVLLFNSSVASKYDGMGGVSIQG